MKDTKRPVRRWRLFGLIAVSALLLFALLSTIPMRPEGKYRHDKIACEGTAFWEIRNGEVWLKIPKDGERGLDYETNYIGRYDKHGGLWICVSPDGQEFMLRATLFSIRLSETNGNKSQKFQRLFCSE
jgi:hypothetical protein